MSCFLPATVHSSSDESEHEADDYDDDDDDEEDDTCGCQASLKSLLESVRVWILSYDTYMQLQMDITFTFTTNSFRNQYIMYVHVYRYIDRLMSMYARQ